MTPSLPTALAGGSLEIGSHEELIHHGEIYHRLHELQYLDEVDAGVDV